MRTVSNVLSQGPARGECPQTVAAALAVLMPFCHLKVHRGDMKIVSMSWYQLVLYQLFPVYFAVATMTGGKAWGARPTA